MMLESVIEHKVIRFAKSLGIRTYKFTSPSQRAVPDRIFLYRGKMIMIEFKRKGEQLRLQQQHEFKKIADEGFRIYVADNLGIAMEILKRF